MPRLRKRVQPHVAQSLRAMVEWLQANPFRMLADDLEDEMSATFPAATAEQREAAIAEAERTEAEQRYAKHIELLTRRIREERVSMWAHLGISFEAYPELRSVATPDQLREYEEIRQRNIAVAKDRREQSPQTVQLRKVERNAEEDRNGECNE